MNPPSSILEVFQRTALDPSGANRRVLECGPDFWTYASLDAVSTGLAADLAALGDSPIVAVVAENHPFVFALMFAVWKLHGTFVPIDAHIPWNLLDGMLDIVKPTFMFLVESDTNNILNTKARGVDFAVRLFGGEGFTIPALSAKYAGNVLNGAPESLPPPDATALYLFTSSASSRHNLKAVPLTHRFIAAGCEAKLAFWHRLHPHNPTDAIRVLGWAPLSHVLAHMQDIGTAALLNAGCYVFATIPSSYTSAETQPAQDITSALIHSVLHYEVKAFAGLPFVIAAFKAACEGGNDRLLAQLRSMTMLECGGAQLDKDIVDWAIKQAIPLVVGVGMTETGGAILAGPVGDASDGFHPQGLLRDAQFSLIGNDDESEGELVIKSPNLPRGYLKYEDGSFDIDAQGVVTFKTGDIYRKSVEGKLLWVGRSTDFIQMATGETLDPRRVERALRFASGINDACIIGNAFLNGSSTAIYAIIELAPRTVNINDDLNVSHLQVVARALSPINRDLPPALRIALSSVLILAEGTKIPRTKKGEIFRKKIDEAFGAALRALGHSATPTEVVLEQEPAAATKPIFDKNKLQTAIVHSLGLDILEIDLLDKLTFAELGMTSILAIRVAEDLNKLLQGQVTLPVNICYLYPDAQLLFAAVQEQLLKQQYPSTTIAPSVPASLSTTSSVPVPLQELDDVVIVGKAFRLPGGIYDDRALWAALTNQATRNPVSYISTQRWDHTSFYPADIAFLQAGLLDSDHFTDFDASFFGMTEKEAYYLSPTMRLALEVAFEALEDANIPVGHVKGTGMGVYAAVKDDGFETLLNAAHGYDAYTRFYGTGRAPSTTSGRISYLLDIHGPSVTVDTACSGGIVCIDQGVNYLQSGQGESAIVCSSNTHCWPGSFMFLTAQGMVSPHGRCASFSAQADGYVPSEGAVAFILKTRKAAVRDGNQILATIRAAVVSHNGRSQGLAAPNIQAQSELHQQALQKANIQPTDIHFVETHGTGTSLGDVCEIHGINAAFAAGHRPSGPLIISASKGTIGHTEPSAGLVGIMAALLSFKHGLVPGLIHTSHGQLNPALDQSKVPLNFSPQTMSLSGEKPYRSVVMSYGFAGTLADIVLEGPAKEAFSGPSNNNNAPHTGPPMIFVLSAKSTSGLQEYKQNYITFLRNVGSGGQLFSKICVTSCIAREHYKHRFSCAAHNTLDLLLQLEHSLSASHKPPTTRIGPITFAFSGQGTQFPSMDLALAQGYPAFKSIVLELGNKAAKLSGFPITDCLLATTASADEGAVHSEVDQICIFVHQYAMSLFLEMLGIVPGAVVGHSLGEITAAVVAGGLSFELGLELVILRAHLLRPEQNKPAGMAALACSEADFLRLPSTDATISVFNSPRSIAISGAASSIETILATAKEQNIKATKLRVDQGFHSSYVEHALPGLKHWSAMNSGSFQALKIPLYSTALGHVVPAGETLQPDHWMNHTRNPVHFAQTAQALKESLPHGITLDLGPQAVAQTLLLANNHPVGRTIGTCGKRTGDQRHAFLLALAELYQQHGLVPNFHALYGGAAQDLKDHLTSLPTYPFQRVRCYPSYIPSRHSNTPGTTVVPVIDAKLRNEVKPAAEVSKSDTDSSTSFSSTILFHIRSILELRPHEVLDTSESLLTYGVDSIGFAALQKALEQQHGLTLSIVFWSDVFSIADIVKNLEEQKSLKM